jgi:hypothetical protein
MTQWGKQQSCSVKHNDVPTGPGTSADLVFKRAVLIGACVSLLPLAGCPYYAAPAGTVVTVPASFDRSFAAASGAMSDQGLAITVQDPSSGTIVGNINGSTVTASVHKQADGSVIVQFSSSDARDPTLLNSISRSYDRRMGR